LACLRKTLTDLERLRAALDDIRATIDDEAAGAAADYEFHDALVQASHSPTLISLYKAMAPLLLRFHHERRTEVSRDAGLKIVVAQDHGRVFDALVAGDGMRADAVLRNHFTLGNEHRLQAATSKATP
jgi:DNA-binding FadR family transcriptional regulator